MKKMRYVFLACMVALFAFPGIAQENEDKEELILEGDKGVEVYYFHFSRRCATCKTVEEVTKNAVNELYGEKVPFTAVNLDEPEGEKKGEEIGVNSQSLLIVSGDTKIDITSEGFMNARSNPDKLKQVIKEKTDPLL